MQERNTLLEYQTGGYPSEDHQALSLKPSYETRVWFLGQKDFLEKEMAILSSILV